ncbi:AGD1 [Auxenochlorella protothecoides x Auxenochlorella symbiontica]|uniref:Prephenate/arogenate dehydrogenase domain-containing protein n=1 Tax=Auxenochlorella protothecoides TaxID=3075 RepID=A0A1D1ZNI6_AUXPR
MSRPVGSSCTGFRTSHLLSSAHSVAGPHPSCVFRSQSKLRERARHPLHSRRALRISSLDAAQGFDFESRTAQNLEEASTMFVGILGFGTFGQFLAARLVKAGHRVIATSRRDYTREAAAMGVEFFADVDDFCEEHPEVVILSTAILSLEKVLAALPVQRLKRSTLFVDVLSVKEFPKQAMLRMLPADADILCTHPMFGPDSGQGSWSGLNFMYEVARLVPGDAARQQRMQNFIRFFAREGCTMVELGCEEHDRQAASTQFITHTVGRMLGEMKLEPTPIDTRGFQSLLSLVGNTNNDSFDLYYGLFMYNPNATQELERLEHAFDSVKRQLFRRLHAKLRDQLFPSPSAPRPEGTFLEAPAAPPAAPALEPGIGVLPRGSQREAELVSSRSRKRASLENGS